MEDFPEINPYAQLIFDKEVRTYNGVKDSLFKKWENGQVPAKLKVDHLLTPYIRLDS